jgi:chromosome segregation ATPase/RNA polymerase subunit RPABC4/transcription elongation factor Spt4
VEGRRITEKSKVPSLEDINLFIKNNLQKELEILDDLQKACNTSVEMFKKLSAQVDPEALDEISEIIDNFHMTSFTINKLKNNIAMKIYKHEMLKNKDLDKNEDELIKLRDEAKYAKDNLKKLEGQIKKSEESATKLVEKTQESENTIADLWAKIKDHENTISELEKESKKLQKNVDDLEKERNKLQSQGPKKSGKTKVDMELLSKFASRETKLKDNIKSEINKWKKMTKELNKVSGSWDKDAEKALKDATKTVEELELELTEKEKQLKNKSVKNRAELTKMKQSVAGKLIRAKKKLDKLEEKRKSVGDDSEKDDELKNEISTITDMIETLEDEYNNVENELDKDQEMLFVFFESLSRLTNGAPENFKELMKKSQEREEGFKTQLEMANTTVEELKKEMEALDESYHSDIKTEYDRMVKKVEDKYKKNIKKEEEKYKKDLEVAAQTIFELKQYVEELEHTAIALKAQMQVQGIDMQQLQRMGLIIEQNETAPNPNPTNAPVGRYGLPMKKPKTTAKGEVKINSKRTKKKKRRKKSIEMGKCGSCGELIPLDSESCPNCGTTFSLIGDELGVCGNCGEVIHTSESSCPYCGAKFE